MYAITDLKAYDPMILDKVEAACVGGAGVIQLRAKSLSDSQLISLGEKIRKITRRYDCLFVMNDRFDLAASVDADGVHVGQDDIPLFFIRKLMKEMSVQYLIGKSTHSLPQAFQAVREKVDYIGVGPVFETPTKPGRLAVGLDLIRDVSRETTIPFVAIGGITISNINAVLDAGARGVAVVRAIFESADSLEATKELYDRISSYEKK